MALGRGSWFGISSFIFSRASTAEGSTTSWLGVGFRIAAALFQTCNQAHHEEGWKWWCFPKHSRSSIYADARIWVPWQDMLTTPQKTTGKVCAQNSWQNDVWWWKNVESNLFCLNILWFWFCKNVLNLLFQSLSTLCHKLQEKFRLVNSLSNSHFMFSTAKYW